MQSPGASSSLPQKSSAMFYPTITFLLWAMLLFRPATLPQEPAPFAPDQMPAFVSGDSTVYHTLANRLAEDRAGHHHEKLYLQLDRTFFTPGSTVWFKAYLRNASDLMPAVGSQILHVQLLDPRGAVLQEKKILAFDGTAAGDFMLYNTMPGGVYKIKAWTNWMLNTEEAFEREITLQKTVLPNVNLRLEFERKGLGPGDEAVARFDALALNNQPIAGRDIRFTVSLDGKEYQTGTVKTDATGRAWVRFRLPESLDTPDGLLNLQLEHDGRPEAISRPVPILLNRVDLQFFPEGGEMVAGIPTRLGFKAVNEFGKPSDVSGRILDSKGRQVARFESFHNGMGACDLVPQAGERYTAKLTQPVGNVQVFSLPPCRPEGYTLRLLERGAKTLRFEIAGSRPAKVFLAGAVRDQLFFFRECRLADQATTVEVPIESLPPGIASFTLFDEQTQGLAERLVFVNRDRGLQIDIQPDKPQYLPREKVRLNLRVRDGNGTPVQGQFSLAVVDEKMLSYADDKQGHILASLLLEQDVKGKIDEPNFYFDAAEPKADQALDFLLMTQGWRRFCWKKSHLQQYQTPPEMTVLSGQFLKSNKAPWAGRKVQLAPNGPETTTDKNGRFEFKNIDLSQYAYLIFPNGRYLPVYDYQQNLVVYADGQTSRYQTWSVPDATGATTLFGNVTDELGEPLIGVSVAVLNHNKVVKGLITNIDGRFEAQIKPGEYDIRFSYTGYNPSYVNGFEVKAGARTCLNVSLETGAPLSEVAILSERSAIATDKTAGGQTLTAEQIKNLPTRDINAIVTDDAPPIDGGDIMIKSGRSSSTVYYIDGIRVSPAVAEDERKTADIDDLPAGVPADFSNEKELAESVVIMDYKVPIIQKDKTQTGATFTADQIEPRSFAEAKPMPSRPYYDQRRKLRFDQPRDFYAPRYDQGSNDAARSDFRYTLYWNPSVRTDASGKASVEFYTSDAITNFRATLEGISSSGLAGRAEHKFFVEKPVNVQVKTPPYVISGDVLRLDLAVGNKTNHAVSGVVDLNVPAHFKCRNNPPAEVSLAPGETRVIPVEYEIGQSDSTTDALHIRFRVPDAGEDAVELHIPTLDRGYPVKAVMSGQSAQNAFNLKLNDPEEGTLRITLNGYPNALEEVLKGMERMLNQPCGCFEQVSSSNYPNLLVLDLLRQSNRSNPEIETRANAMLASGYQQLAAYECKNGGFDWWGRDPAHEGLTAYGIMEFVDMKRVYPVDQGLIDRSVNWLLSRRDGNGGWKRREDWHGWQSDGVIGAYIAWAVCEAGYGNKFMPEINAAYKDAIQSDDPYRLALLANAMLIIKDPRANELLTRLLKKQEENGAWTGTSHSVTYSSGEGFRVETTSLAALALMKEGKHAAPLAKAMQYIAGAKNEYGYGSTQSTVLALKALTTFARQGAEQDADSRMIVQIDGKRVIEQPFSTRDARRLEIKGLERYVTGENARVEVFFEGGKAVLPFDLEVQYASRMPRNASNCPLAFSTTLENNHVTVGQTVRLSALLRNDGTSLAASPMVVVGIPAGLSLQPWQLKKLMDEKKCDFYEIWDGFAVFHFERLGPGEQRRLDLDLRADLAGSFEAPASQAFLYYQNEQRVWSKPERVVIE